MHRVIRHKTHGLAINAAKSGNDVGGVVFLNFDELVIVAKLREQIHHVIAGVRVIRHEGIQLGVLGHLLISRRIKDRRLIEAGQRQVVEQIAHQVEGIILRGHHDGDVAVELLLTRGTEVMGRDLLTCDLLDDVRTRHVHLRLTIDGDDEVRGHRRIHRTTGGLAHHDGDLRAAATKRQLAAGNLGVHGKRGHRILDAGTTGILDADDRAANLDGQIHDVGDLLTKGHAHGTAVDGLVVRIDAHRAAVDAAVAGDHAVGVNRIRVAGGFA